MNGGTKDTRFGYLWGYSGCSLLEQHLTGALSENQVQSITYADSLGGNLQSLNELLLRHFAAVFGSIHILPLFPSSGDRGFAPLTCLDIEPKLGTWEDML